MAASIYTVPYIFEFSFYSFTESEADVQNCIQRCNIRCDMRYDVDGQGDQRQKQVCVNTPVAILDNVRSRIRAGEGCIYIVVIFTLSYRGIRQGVTAPSKASCGVLYSTGSGSGVSIQAMDQSVGFSRWRSDFPFFSTAEGPRLFTADVGALR